MSPSSTDTKQDDKKLIEFLRTHPVGVLSTVTPEGDPHASTIYFSVDDELNITFTTKLDTRKSHNIDKHPVVMLAVYDAASQAAAQVIGHTRKITDPSAVLHAFRGTLRAASKTGEDSVPPISKIMAGPYVAYVITPTEAWLSEYGWGDNFANALKHAHDTENLDDPA